METKLNDNMCDFKIGACYKNTKYDPNSDNLRGVKYFVYCGENTFLPICDWEYEMSVKLDHDTWENFVEVTKDEAFGDVNDVKLNDNEVKEVARMQELIDCYELTLRSLFLITKHNCNINYPQFADSPIKKEINYLWRWVKEHKDNK